MRKIFFTADTHFSHSGIIKSCNRPFVNYDEMNEALISNWNNKVDVLDEVYHLGDVIWRGNRQQVEETIYRLNGKIHIIKGNHDHSKQVNYLQGCKNIAWIKDYFELEINKQQLFVLFHYSMRTWNKSYHGSYHLYGHSHGNLEQFKIKNSMDVGVDVHNYFPIELNEVLEKI